MRFNECDPAGVVFNGNYPTYIDVSMIELWREAVGGIEAMHTELGVGMLVAAYSFELRLPLRPDDEIAVELALQHIGTTSITLTTAIRRDDQTVTTGSIRYVCVDPRTYAKTPVPERLRDRLTALATPDPV